MAGLTSRAFEQTSLGSARFRAVIGASLLIMIGFGLIVPALPLFAKRFGVGKTGIGLVLTVFAATRLVGDLFAGSLIDRFGERMVAAVGATIVGVSSIAAGAAPTYAALVVLRGVGGFGSAFFLGGLMAYLIGTVPAERRGRAMSVFQAAIGIGLLIGPLFGGLIIAWASVNTPLYAYGAICIGCAPLVLRAMGPERVPSDALAAAPAVPEPEGVPAPAGRAWARLRPLLADPTYRAAIAVSGMGFLVTGALQALIPLLWDEELGASKAWSGLPFTVMALTGIAIVWHAGSVSDRRGRRFALIPALVGTGTAVAALGVTHSVVGVIVVMGVLGISTGYTRPGPTAMIADIASPESRGVAVSGYRTAGDVGALIGPILAGSIAEGVGFSAAFLTLAAVVGAVFVLALRARETAPSVAR